jgi:hypothetical protein
MACSLNWLLLDRAPFSRISTPSRRLHPRGAMHRRQLEKEMTDVRMS